MTQEEHEMTEALEITTFKLNGQSCKEFIAANADIDEWLKRQPGFRSRRIAERDDGTIVDMLIWDSAEEGRRAASGIMTEMGHSLVHGMIDQITVDWTVAPVRHWLR
jgi:hypothetical protein